PRFVGHRIPDRHQYTAAILICIFQRLDCDIRCGIAIVVVDVSRNCAFRYQSENDVFQSFPWTNSHVSSRTESAKLRVVCRNVVSVHGGQTISTRLEISKSEFPTLIRLRLHAPCADTRACYRRARSKLNNDTFNGHLLLHLRTLEQEQNESQQH